MIDLSKVNVFPITAFVITLFALSSGTNFIFIFDRDLFNTLDLFKLLILSFSNTGALIALNSTVLNIKLSQAQGNNSERTDAEFIRSFSVSLLFGSILTLPVIFIPILIGSFVSLGFKWGLSILIVTELLVFLGIKFAFKNNLK